MNLPGLFNSVPLIHKEIGGHCVTHRIGRYVIEQSVDVSQTDTGLAVQHLVQQTIEDKINRTNDRTNGLL